VQVADGNEDDDVNEEDSSDEENASEEGNENDETTDTKKRSQGIAVETAKKHTFKNLLRNQELESFIRRMEMSVSRKFVEEDLGRHEVLTYALPLVYNNCLGIQDGHCGFCSHKL
jgi:hypothetical protein